MFFHYVVQSPNYMALKPQISYSLYLRSLARLYGVAQVKLHNAMASRRVLGPTRRVPAAVLPGVEPQRSEAEHSTPSSVEATHFLYLFMFI